MKRQGGGELAVSRPASKALRYSGLAILCMQLVYVCATALSSTTTGIASVYDLTLVVAMLAVMVVLAAMNTVQLFSHIKSRRMAIFAIVIHYLSVGLFTFCVSNQNRDGVIALLWVIVLSTTGIIFGRRAFTVGAIAAFGATLSSPVIQSYKLDHFVALILLTFLTIYTSFLFYRYREAGLIELRYLNQIKRRERLQTRRLKALVNNVKDALITVSPEGDVQLYNPAAMDLLNTNVDLIGKDIDDIFNVVDEQGRPLKMSEIIDGVMISSERTDLRIDYGDKQYANIRLTIIPIRHEFDPDSKHELDGDIIMAADITKQKSLDDERDEFIGVVSHELRTPVAIAEGALSNLQLLLERGGDPKQFETTLDAAHKQILYLGQMVNDLSTLSRAQRGLYMDNDEIDIDSFITSLYDKYKTEADEHNLRLVASIDAKGKIHVPEMVVEEIMQNLITNALKYTENGSVTIGARKIPSDKSHVELYVKDTGIGISKSDQEHVFERFWRSEDYRTRKTNGTGLGLHVVDQLAKKVNTKVTLESKLGKGSTFSIALPLTK